MTHEQDFYREMYQTKFRGDDTIFFQIFGVPIGDAKITRKLQFHLAASVINIHVVLDKVIWTVIWLYYLNYEPIARTSSTCHLVCTRNVLGQTVSS